MAGQQAMSHVAARPLLASAMLVAALAGTASAEFGGCTPGVECTTIEANGFVFECRVGGNATSTRGDVVLLHGFPEWSEMYMPLMQQLKDIGYRSLACNQRGYSPHAAPSTVADYNYNYLVSDVFALADAANFTGKFHLVGHDHGALLGWTVAASAVGKQRLLSYSSLSIPHADAFSAGLHGPDADLQQQIASQYFTMFVLNNSASLHLDFFFNAMGKTSGDENTGSFKTPADFQKALWWYNGAGPIAGVMAFPPLMSAASLLKHGAVATAGLRELFGGTPDNGTAATHPIGDVAVPTLYVCGKADTAILCSRPYALKTADYCKAGYIELTVDCGHDLLSCNSKAATTQVEDAILQRIVSASPGHRA